MRYKHFPLLALIVCCLFVCSFKTEDKFDEGGMRFNIPAGWKVTEREDLEGAGYYVACEKTGEDASGLVAITWINQVVPLDEIAENYAKHVKDGFTEKKADPQLAPAVKAKYNNIECVRVAYTLKLLGIPHRGTISCFHVCDKTVMVMEQEANEDAKENEGGFQEIEKSLGCK